MTDADTDRFRRGARTLKTLSTLILAGLIFILAGFAITLVFSPRMTADLAVRISVPWLPAVFYMWILLILRRVFGDLAADGLLFRPALATALLKTGIALMLGALTTLMVGPLVNILAAPHRFGGIMIFDVPALALVMVGFALVMLARMMKRAAALENEAQGLRDVMETFI